MWARVLPPSEAVVCVPYSTHHFTTQWMFTGGARKVISTRLRTHTPGIKAKRCTTRQPLRASDAAPPILSYQQAITTSQRPIVSQCKLTDS